MSGAEAEYDVAIVGCGPVGALAANLLGRAGLRTIVLEREPAPYALPRAVHIDHEMMRIFQSVGLAQTMLPLMREAHGHIHIGADAGVIRYLGSKGLPKRFGWANDYFFFQPELEAALGDAFERFPNVTLRRGVEVIGIEHGEDCVRLNVQGRDEAEVTARYVVACDGAASFVRKALGIGLADLGFEEPWLVIDAEVDGPIHFPDFSGVPADADLQHLSVMLCDPKRPATLVPGRGNHRRWEFMLLPGEDDAEMMQPSLVAALIAPYVQDVRCRVIRAATYRFHGLIAEEWQRGRIFLAGDAAHQTPPFFGQGMCHGFRDVANLTWKLKAVLRGGVTSRLLEIYQTEREPHVRAVVNAAIAAGRYICERDSAAAAKRDASLRAAMGKPAPASASDLIPPIGAGVVDDGGRSGIGARFIQPFVERDGRRMLLDDATGAGFVLLTTTPGMLAGLDARQKGILDRIGVSTFVVGDTAGPMPALNDIEGRLGGWFVQHGTAAVLLRPDRYVFGTAASTAELARLTTQLGEALAPF